MRASTISSLALATVISIALGSATGYGHAQETASPGPSPTASQPPGGGDPEPFPAVDGVVDALADYPVVALGESHNLAEAGNVYNELARSDLIARAADAFVVEFGNARFQGIADRYTSGRHVRPSRLKMIWQDTTQVGAWDAPMYRRFFAAVRAGNAGRKPARQMRVLLGDPPINWSTVSSEEDVRQYLRRREPFMAKVIERQVLAKGERAIVIAGLAHVQRRTGSSEHPNVTQILDRQASQTVWVIGVHLGFPLPEWEASLSEWPIPSVVALEGTWIGELPEGDGLAQEALDGMLYLGAPDSLHLSMPLPSVYRDDSYWRTLRRRWPIGVGGVFSAKVVFAAYRDAGYPGLFSQREIGQLYDFANCMRDHGVEAFPDPQFQYDAAGFYGPAIHEAREDPDFETAFEVCAGLLS
jgi:hypothetical protein